MSNFKRGINFPNEGFVQNAIESYFNSSGYSRQDVQHVDLVCINVNNERWVIEAKGETSSIGVDFNTGLVRLSNEWMIHQAIMPLLYRIFQSLSTKLI